MHLPTYAAVGILKRRQPSSKSVKESLLTMMTRSGVLRHYSRVGVPSLPSNSTRLLSTTSYNNGQQQQINSCFKNKSSEQFRNQGYRNRISRPIMIENKLFFSTSPKNNNNNEQRQRPSPGQQQYNKLVRNSKSLLGNLHQIESVTKRSKEIVELINQWYDLWGPTSSASASIPLHRSTLKNNNSSSSFVTQESVEFVDKLMHELLDITEEMIHQNQHINTSLRNPVLMAILGWERVRPTQSTGIRSEQLLDRILEIQNLAKIKQIDPPVQVTTVIFGAVISTWSNSIDHIDGDKKINGGHMAENVLNKMKEFCSQNENEDVRPNLIVHNTCLHGYAQRGMIKEAEALLKQLEENCNYESVQQGGSEEELLSPDVYTYSTMMNAYEKVNGRIEGMPIEKRAQKLLSKMIEKYERTGDRRFMPNHFTIGSVISILAKSRSVEGAAEADRILHWFLESYQKDVQSSTIDEEQLRLYPIGQPKVDHYITVFLGYGRRRDKRKAFHRIGELLVEMEQLHDTGLVHLKPNYQCFVIYLDNLVKSNESNKEEKVDTILTRIEDMYLNVEESEFVINNYGYNLLINAIVKSRKNGRVERVEAVLDRMNNLYEKTGNKTLLPDRVSYTCLIKAHTLDKIPGYAKKCQSILKFMEEGFKNGKLNLKPDKYVYASVVHAVSNEGYPEDCEKLVEEMEILGAKNPDAYPSILCYNALIASYGRRRRSDSASNAMRILEKIHSAQAAGNNDLKPVNITYSTCIDALARSVDNDKVQKAEQLMTKLLELHRATNDDDLAPTTHVWCSLMLVYAESKLPKKALKAKKIIERMKAAGVECDTVTFNTLLKACAKTNNFDEETRLQVLEISKYAFSEIQNSNDSDPDTLTFNTLMWISDKFIVDEEEKKATIKSLFITCCSEGQVNDNTISALMKIATKDVVQELLGDQLTRKRKIEIRDLPKEWSRNRNRFRYRERK